MPPERSAFSLLALCCSLWACGGAEESAPSTGPDGGQAGAAGGVGTCAAGERPLDDGSCLPAGDGAGVPPDACGAGFAADGAQGCAPIMPESPCLAGLIAVPGDASCRELAPCGTGAWGELVLGADTEHVDPSYTGGASDGSAAAPWTTIADALAAAADNAIVALAQGSYDEDVRIEARPVRLWGRCPSLVSITGTGLQPAAVSIVETPGVELRGVGVSGPRVGVWALGAEGLGIADVWIHDAGSYGLAVKAPMTGVSVRNTLVERAAAGGMLVQGASGALEGVAIRDSLPNGSDALGVGLTVQRDPDSGLRGSLTVAGSVVERSLSAGVLVHGSDVQLERSVVRDVLPQASDAQGGHGILARADLDSHERSSLQLSTSLVERCTDHGIAVLGSDGSIDASVVRDVAPQPTVGERGWGIAFTEDEIDGTTAQGSVTRSLVERATQTGAVLYGADVSFDRLLVRDIAMGANGIGRGIAVESSELGPGRSRATIRSCLVERVYDSGILVTGGIATVESTAIRDTWPGGVDGAGYGVALQVDFVTLERGETTVRGCTVERSSGGGIVATGTDVTVEATAVRSTGPDARDEDGTAIAVQFDPENGVAGTGTIRSCLVQDSREFGILLIGVDAQVVQTIVERTAPSSAGRFGDGLAVSGYPGWPGFGSIVESRISDSARAGVATFGAAVELRASALECNAIHLDGELGGGHDFALTDLGGNRCGCGGVQVPCVVLSSDLEPPQPLD